MQKLSGQNSSGYTLIEFIVVITIISILVAISFVMYNNSTANTTKSALTNELASIAKVLETDALNNAGLYPASLAVADGGDGIVAASSEEVISYQVDNTMPRNFCVSTSKTGQTYHIDSTHNIMAGPCPLLYYDAGNSDSYVSSGTTWYDLSGNGIDASLVNGLGYSATDGGGSLVFSSSNCNKAIFSLPANLSTYTFSIWIKTVPDPWAEKQIFVSSTGGFGITVRNGSFLIWNGTVNYATQQIVPNKWYNLVLQYSGPNPSIATKLIVNLADWGTFSNAGVISSGQGTIGYHMVGDQRCISASIGSFALYNSGLSIDQITYNYNSQKARFGY